jgi:rod shape determining protein RodA
MSRLREVLPRRLDWRLVFSVAALSAIGILMVVSTTAGTARADLANKQLLALGIGAAVAAVLVAIDYRILLQYSPGLWAVSLAPLVWLLFFGHRIAGAKSWIRFGAGFQVQPSELVKLSTALLLAWILENEDRRFLRLRNVLLVAGTVAFPALLVLAEPDLGVSLTYVPLLLAAIYLGGLRARWWMFLVLAACLAVGGSWFVLKPYQKDRIRTFLDPNLEARGAGYQVRQARIAIGSGEIVGKGWQKGSQSRLGFLPVRHTDFIFSALAEEFGFIGVTVVLGLFGLLLARAIALARDARDRGGSMLVLLLAVTITVQTIVNVCMNVGLLPTTGITLPFLSYGGSSMIASWGMVGLMLSVAYRRFVNV